MSIESSFLTSYRKEYPTITSRYKTDDELADALYDQNKEELEKKYKSSKEYKQALGLIPTSQARSKIKTDESIEQDIIEIDPDTYSRKKKESQIIESTQRTLGGAAVTTLQNFLDVANTVAKGIPGSMGTLARDEKFSLANKKAQQQALIKGATKLFGEETVKKVTRDGIESLDIEDPTYKGGKVVTDMGTLMANIIGWQKQLTKVADPKNLSTAKKWLQGTTSGLLGEQTGWDIYEERLFNMLGEYIGDDQSSYADFVRYMEADRDDPQLEARIGVLVEGSMLAGGLSLFWQAGKGAYKEGIKPATQAAMKKLRELRRVKDAEKQSKFRKSLDEGTVYGRSQKQKKKEAEVKYKTKEEQAYSQTKQVDLIEEEEALGDLWQFKGEFGDAKLIDTIQRTVYDYTGARLFKSRGQYTPKLFELFNAGENAKRAWTTRAEHIVRRLEGEIWQIVKQTDEITGEATTKEFDEMLLKIQSYLDGESIKLPGMSKAKVITREEIPKSLRPILDEARVLQDDLSELYTKSDYVPKSVKKIISSNIGTYLRKSYDFYEAGVKPPQEVMDNATRYFEGVLRRGITTTPAGRKRFLNVGNKKYEIIDNKIVVDGTERNVNSYIRENSKARVESIVGTRKEAKDMFDYVDLIYGRLPKETLAKRKKLPKAVRELLGETKDPRATILNSISKVANAVETDNFLSQAWQLGKGKYFHTDKTGIYTEQILNRNMGAMYGKYTTPQMARIFKEQSKMSGWVGTAQKGWGYFLGAKGWGQASKTVLNHITHIRNTIGGATFMLANGMNPFSKETKDAFKVLQNEIDLLGKRKGKGTKDFDKGLDNLYEKYQKLGIVNTSAKAGDFKALIDDAAKYGAEGTTYRFLRKALNIPQKLYIAEDDLFKIAAFNKEVATLTKAYGKGYSKEALEREAANIVKNTIPNYDMVPNGIKQLRKLPFGNFFSFPAEMVRTSANIVRQGLLESISNNGEIRKRGFKRLGGFMGAGLLGAEGASRATQTLSGVTDRSVDAMRHLLEAEYSQYTNQLYIRDSEGSLYKNNFSYIDPYDVIKAPLRTIIMEYSDGKRTQDDIDRVIINATGKAIAQFLKPFTEEALLTEGIWDTAFREGKTKEGQRIEGWEYSEDFDFEKSMNNMMVGFRHVLETFTPGSVPQIQRLYKSFSDDPILPSGQELERKTEIAANFTGFRWQKVTDQYIESSLRRKIWKYGRATEQVRSDMWQVIGKDKNEKDVIKGYLQAQRDHYKNWKDLKFAQDSAKVLYQDVMEYSNSIAKTGSIMQEYAIKSGVLSKKDLYSLNHNRFKPIEFSENQKNRIVKDLTFKFTDSNGLLGILNKYTQQFYSLPMLDLEHQEYKDELIETLQEGEWYTKPARKILEEEERKERQPKFKGGTIHEDYPVLNVKKEPSEMINKATGLPYEAEMERLGMEDGGLLVSIGVAPVSEKQISKLKNKLKERKAKRDGGEIRQRYAFGDRIKKALKRRGEAELLRQKALTNAPSYIRDKVLEATPTALKTYMDKVVLGNREAITEKDFKEKQMRSLDTEITNKVRKGIKSGEYFLNKDGQLKAIRNQDGKIGSKSNKDNGYFIDLDTKYLDKDIFRTIGSSGVEIRKEKPKYNIVDEYDFAFEFAGEPTPRGFNKDNIKQYRRADEAGRHDASYLTRDWKGKKLLSYALPLAERYGAGQLPDELTATQLSKLEGKEVMPESVNINIGSALNIAENEWAELMEQANTNRDNIDSWINYRYSKVEDSLIKP
tara:strand:- start:124 stop:5379 length:5256 start_codon:yes stop_codon:yes gene_type:complete